MPVWRGSVWDSKDGREGIGVMPAGREEHEPVCIMHRIRKQLVTPAPLPDRNRDGLCKVHPMLHRGSETSASFSMGIVRWDRREDSVVVKGRRATVFRNTRVYVVITMG